VDEIRIRAATAADVPAIVDTVDRAYRHYIVLSVIDPPAPNGLFRDWPLKRKPADG
jgi:hypothetical protein